MRRIYDPFGYLFEESRGAGAFISIAAPRVFLESIRDYRVKRDLFDWEFYARKIGTNELDENVNSREEFDLISRKVADVDLLYLIDERPTTDVHCVAQFGKATLGAYARLFRARRVNSLIVKPAS